MQDQVAEQFIQLRSLTDCIHSQHCYIDCVVSLHCSGAGLVITEQEMHKLSKLGHDSEAREKAHEYETCTTHNPAYVNSSQQGNEEPVYDSI